MPLRRTKRSDGLQRPKWKDGSHVYVENTHANESRCEVAFEPNSQAVTLKRILQLHQQNQERGFSTRDRPARTGADARIEESAAIGEVRLALRHYGRKFKRGFRQRPINNIMLSRTKTGGNCPAAGRIQVFSVSDRAAGRGIVPGSRPWKQLGLWTWEGHFFD